MNSSASPAPGASLFNNAAVNRVNNVVNNAMTNTMKNLNLGAPSSTTAKAATMVLFGLTALVIFLIFYFWRTIADFFGALYERIRSYFGGAQAQPPPPAPSAYEAQPAMPEPAALERPVPTQEEQPQQNSLVEKILPGHKEVFNVSRNNYTYYDAEPLCKALGAELATYEQVKQAYEGGADWCNYGWTKGQMAVYPTQKESWEQLQNGPEEQRNACGRPGVNGGYFDNPELRFGVNCYGAKPEQSLHDQAQITSNNNPPPSPAQLEFDKKVNKYRSEANYIPILPFSTKSWSN